MLHGAVLFPGVANFISATMSLNHGITPSSCVLTMPPQPTISMRPGTLTFLFGPTRVQFFDVIPMQPRLEASEGGYVWIMPLLDRRWKWSNGELNGRFNIRRPNGTLEGEIRNAKELVNYILNNMDEKGFSVQGIPTKDFPEVEWDRANPAQELAELCDLFGCRIILGLDNRVKIRPVGEGKLLPADGEDINATFSFSGGALPSKIKIVSGPTLYESKLSMRAVGLDIDGKIKPLSDTMIAAKLSELGTSLEAEPPENYPSLESTTYVDPNDLQLKKVQDLARSTFFRWYQVYKQAHHGATHPMRFSPPGWSGDPLKSIRQTRLRDTRAIKVHDLAPNVLTEMVDIDGFLPSRVEGAYFRSHFDHTMQVDTDTYDGSFSIDPENGIVAFGEPVYQITGAGFAEADLVLLTSYTVLRNDIEVVDRFAISDDVIPNGGGTMLIKRPDLEGRVIQNYDGRNLKEIGTNFEKLKEEIADHMKEIKRRLKPTVATDVLYRGIRPIEPDGAIQQVTFQVREDGAYTRASRNTEHRLSGSRSYEERRTIERTKRLAVLERARRGLSRVRG